jgi:hypothetical protein
MPSFVVADGQLEKQLTKLTSHLIQALHMNVILVLVVSLGSKNIRQWTSQSLENFSIWDNKVLEIHQEDVGMVKAPWHRK